MSDQVLRRLGWRQPLWGTGVTSLIEVTSMPVCWMLRTAVSRPEPGPFTCTSTRRRPCSIAARAALSAAICAANGVLLREPLKPTPPDDAHEMTLPSVSVTLTMVLLNELLMCTTPTVTFLRSRLRGRRPPGFGFAIALLPHGLLLVGNGLLRTLARASVGVGPLAADGQTLAM